MDKVKVFLDSDVIVSALLSQKGASFEILKNSNISKTITKTIKAEVSEVVKRLHISYSSENIFKNIEIFSVKLDKPRLAKIYLPYVLDEEDSHVVAGASKTKTRFLLTHNVKHYHIELIKRDLQIITVQPGIFLQYLRSKYQETH